MTPLFALVNGETSLRLSLATLEEVFGVEERPKLFVLLGEDRGFRLVDREVYGLQGGLDSERPEHVLCWPRRACPHRGALSPAVHRSFAQASDTCVCGRPFPPWRPRPSRRTRRPPRQRSSMRCARTESVGQAYEPPMSNIMPVQETTPTRPPSSHRTRGTRCGDSRGWV